MLIFVASMSQSGGNWHMSLRDSSAECDPELGHKPAVDARVAAGVDHALDVMPEKVRRLFLSHSIDEPNCLASTLRIEARPRSCFAHTHSPHDTSSVKR
jgi:hypothetical protein